MGIPLDLAQEEDWALLLDYASSSIHVDPYGDPATDPIGTLHDCGSSISLQLSTDEATDLQGQLDPHLQVRPFTPEAHRGNYYLPPGSQTG